MKHLTEEQRYTIFVIHENNSRYELKNFFELGT